MYAKNHILCSEFIVPCLINRLTCNDIYAQKDESRYNLINQMLISETLSDEVSMFQTMKQYAGYDEVTKKVFKLL